MLNMVDILGVDLWQPISGGKKGGRGGGGEGNCVTGIINKLHFYASPSMCKYVTQKANYNSHTMVL